jgi:cytochrome oxidase Cu insertion factor (SCO1/SenC/PrrC family)
MSFRGAHASSVRAIAFCDRELSNCGTLLRENGKKSSSRQNASTSTLQACTPLTCGRLSLIFASLFLLFVTPVHAAEPHDPDYDYDPPKPGTYTLPVIKPAADGALLDTNNKSINLRDLTHGKITILSFIYTRCAAPRACPYAMGVLSQLNDLSTKDDSLAENMRLVSISFDPEYDTPQRLASYSNNVREEKSGCEWRFVTGKSRAELAPILAAYDQAVDKRPNESDPQGPLYHTLRVFLIDREGRIRNIYSSGTLDPRLVVVDVKTLILEAQAR